MEQLTAYDRYPWEYNTFILGGDVILIENDLLADALNALPQDNRDILLMYWFLEMADREIAERMNLDDQQPQAEILSAAERADGR